MRSGRRARSNLTDLVSTPPNDLSALRHALWPLCVEPVPPAVVRAVLGLAAADIAAGRRTLHDTVTVLRQLRGTVPLPPDLNESIGDFVNAHMLAVAGVRGTPAEVEEAIARWLQHFVNATLDEPAT